MDELQHTRRADSFRAPECHAADMRGDAWGSGGYVPKQKIRIAVIGLGYIGLPTALCLADAGHSVTGVDIKRETVDRLNRGEVTFEEAGLIDLYNRARSKGITFTTEYPTASLYIVTMPTPYIEATRKVDASYIVRAVASVLEVMERGATVVVESTVSPGTIDEHVRPLFAAHGYTLGVDAHLAHAPERIIPGNMLYELTHVARTIGADEPEIGELVRSVYASFCTGEIVVTDIRTAEMTKVVENTYRSINIAYANELMRLCDASGMDVYEVIRIANMHPRVNVLTPGPGVGGHCISVDPWFLVGDYGGLAPLTFAAVGVNAAMPEYTLDKLLSIMRSHDLSQSDVGIYGVTYKEDVDDRRDSPTEQLLRFAHKRGMEYDTFDPFYDDGYDDFIASKKLIVIMVAHTHIKNRTASLDGKLVLDTKNVLPKRNGVYKL